MDAEVRIFWENVADYYEELEDYVDDCDEEYSCEKMSRRFGIDDELSYFWEGHEGSFIDKSDISFPVKNLKCWVPADVWNVWADNDYGDWRRDFCHFMAETIREGLEEYA